MPDRIIKATSLPISLKEKLFGLKTHWSNSPSIIAMSIDAVCIGLTFLEGKLGTTTILLYRRNTSDTLSLNFWLEYILFSKFVQCGLKGEISYTDKS
jgi:hypothetical protein